jgi:hypothetical protein
MTLKEEYRGITDAILTALATCLVFIIDEFVKHPVGSLASVVGLLFVYERYRTQRVERKIKNKELENIIKNENKS